MDFFEIAKEWSRRIGVSVPSFKDRYHLYELKQLLMENIKDDKMVEHMMDYFEKNNSKPKIRRKPIDANNPHNSDDI